MKELGISEYYIKLTLHDAFDEGHFFVEKLEDGFILYTGNPEYPDYFTYFGIAYSVLSDDEKFMSVCEKWIYYYNDKSPDGSYMEEDFLAGEWNGDEDD